MNSLKCHKFQLLQWSLMLISLGCCCCKQPTWLTVFRVFSGKCNHAFKCVCNSIFLCSVSSETSGFVDKLFESLYTKSYLPSAEPTKAEAKAAGQEKEEVKEEVMLFILPAFYFQISSPAFVRQNVKEKYTLLWLMISVCLKNHGRWWFRQEHFTYLCRVYLQLSTQKSYSQLWQYQWIITWKGLRGRNSKNIPKHFQFCILCEEWKFLKMFSVMLKISGICLPVYWNHYFGKSGRVCLPTVISFTLILSSVGKIESNQVFERKWQIITEIVSQPNRGQPKQMQVLIYQNVIHQLIWIKVAFYFFFLFSDVLFYLRMWHRVMTVYKSSFAYGSS